MSQSALGLLVGGLLPALLFGVVAVLQKTSAQLGLGLGPYLLWMGVGVSAVGAVAWWRLPAGTALPIASLVPVAMGVLWAAGMGAIALALGRLQAPLSQLAPLYNTNTLIAVVLSLVIYAEWQQVAPGRVLLGAALIVVGSILVAR